MAGLSHRYGIDSLVVRNQRCFGWGWFLDDVQPAIQCELRLPLASGDEQSLVCIPGGMRADLRASFPDVPHAAAAGFLVQGRLRGRLAESPATLAVTLRDGSVRYCEVPTGVIARPATEGSWARRIVTRGRRLAARVRTAGLAQALGMLRERACAAMALWRLRWRRGPVALVFDHAMGGGANHFRHGLVDRLVAEGRAVVVVTPLLHALQYRVVVHWRGRERQRLFDDPGPVLEAMSRVPRLDVHVNELVSFEVPEAMLDWCVAQRARARGELVFYLHDYHAVCPAFTLVGVSGHFCGVPDLAACRRCLPANAANTMGFSAGVELPEWRATWAAFLAACDRVVAFSPASVEILRRAHPGLPGEAALRVEPHRPDTRMLRPAHPSPPADGQLVIGVAGHVSAAKGAGMLRAMAEIIRRERLPMRIVVFGTLEHHDQADGIQVLGEYRKAELPSLLEQHGVTVCLLPSICAETFSFVTAEYMAMDMPVAVFPIGAPAERVAGYHKGLVISRIDAATALDEIARFAAGVVPGAVGVHSAGS